MNKFWSRLANECKHMIAHSAFNNDPDHAILWLKNYIRELEKYKDDKSSKKRTSL